MLESEIKKMRAAFGRCDDCAEKQIGLRRLRDIWNLGDRAPQRCEALAASLPGLLAYAQERTKRNAERRALRVLV
jgi:hypothetical protein